jgi:uncharacterized protein
VRTYVTGDGKPGVWFFSLDAASAIAVKVARAWFHLPYFHARMKCEEFGGSIHYESERIHRRAPLATLGARYRPTKPVFHASQGTLEHFLTERYCLYAANRKGKIRRGEIHHPPWPLQIADAEFLRNSMTEAAGIPLSTQAPLLHFSKRQDVVVWQPRELN